MSVSVHGQATMVSYAGVNNPMTEQNFPTRGGNSTYNTFYLEDTAASAGNSVRLSALIDVPDADSIQVTAASFSIIKVINGAAPVTQLSNILLALSKWNPEGDATNPSIFARNAEGGLVTSVLTTPSSFNFVGPTVPAVRRIYLTDQTITLGTTNFPRLVAVGDYYERVLTVSLNVTLGATTTPITLTSSAFVRVVNRTAAPITGIASVYLPENVATSATAYSGGTFSSTVLGLSNADYNRGWYIVGGSNPASFVPVNVTVSSTSGGIIFSASPGLPSYFFRVVMIDPWASPPSS